MLQAQTVASPVLDRGLWGAIDSASPVRRSGWRCQRALAIVSRCSLARDRPVRSMRRSARCSRSAVRRWARSARRMIAHARVVGWRAWLSLYNSTTTFAPKVAYCSSRRTHSCSSAGDRSRAGRVSGLSAMNTGSRGGVAGRPVRWWAAAMARAGGPLRGCGWACRGRGDRRLCAATARWSPARPRRHSRCRAVRRVGRRVRPRRGRPGSGWVASPAARRTSLRAAVRWM